MDITSPFFVVSLIAVIFAVGTWTGATTREDGREDGHESH